MKLNLNQLTPSIFMRQFWQKRPVVIRQALSDFEDLITADELAGLACEEMVESRCIYRQENRWQAQLGPIDSYHHLGEKDWTLVVQALNNWLPAASDLIRCFDFIPRWRFDDVMVSYAAPGGSVGPHIDRYDTFICQGSGSRRWCVGERGNHQEVVPHPALLHTEKFIPIIDEELHQGDILYIPPGFPHEGISIDQSMSFSVGYRTDSAKDMLSGFSDFLIDNDFANQLIEDPQRDVCDSPGLVEQNDLEMIRKHLLSAFDEKFVREFSGSYLTRSKCELDLITSDFSQADLLEMLKIQPLIRLGGLRCLYFDNYLEKREIYINGEQTILEADACSLIPILCNEPILSYSTIAQQLKSNHFVKQLVIWVNEGYWYFEE